MAIGISSLFRVFAKKGSVALDRLAERAVKNKNIKTWLEARQNPRYQQFKALGDAETGAHFNNYI